MIFYSHLTSKYYFFLPFYLFLFSFTHFTHSLSQIKLSHLSHIHQTLTSVADSSSTATIEAHHRHRSSPSHHHRSIIHLPFIFFFFLPPLLTGPTPLPHTPDPCWPISPSPPTQALSLKSQANLRQPISLLFCLTHVALSDPSWPLFSVWVTNFFKAYMLIYKWVVSVFFIM